MSLRYLLYPFLIVRSAVYRLPSCNFTRADADHRQHLVELVGMMVRAVNAQKAALDGTAYTKKQRT
jgi:hypothetical protein